LRIFNLIEPSLWYFVPAQPIVIPLFALGTVKPTVLNRFGFRQTNLVPGSATGKRTAAVDLDE